MMQAHDPSQPFFMYLALHDVHQPVRCGCRIGCIPQIDLFLTRFFPIHKVEAPVEFINRYPASDYNATNHDRRIYNAMVREMAISGLHVLA